ncbi:YihY/virulence factor BrkB family protein [Algicella marina]|uniref:YihY family inner membrane protein n=1 Tax=Algicella marina TaxID=2683284 RepID=A0A6P1T5P8_9RHOB|nr:YihY/virulence factor BrkB family protein [Algicella marina]QHQ36619.1 YihY family inner membrane protein [Algicella marina]
MPFNSKVTINHLVLQRDKFAFRDWLSIMMRVGNGIGEKNLSMMAAGIAFFAMLALFPGLTATISVYGYFADPVVVQDNISLLRPVLPEEVYALVDQRVTALVTSERTTLGLASLVSSLLATWSARAGVTAMISGLNVICREENTRNFIWNMVVAYGLTLLMLVVVLMTLATVVVVPTIMALVPHGDDSKLLIDVIRWLVALMSVTIGIGALYHFGPSRRSRRLPWLTIGSVFAVLMWIVVSTLFSIYLRNFGNYNEVYGSLGAVVALLMWFYLSAFVVLLGAELNAEIEDHAIDVIRERYPHLLARNDPIMREIMGDL